MRFLLDTHVLLWWRDASPLLSPLASAEIAAGENEVLVSIASFWEITIKRSLGKLAWLLLDCGEVRGDLGSVPAGPL